MCEFCRKAANPHFLANDSKILKIAKELVAEVKNSGSWGTRCFSNFAKTQAK